LPDPIRGNSATQGGPALDETGTENHDEPVERLSDEYCLATIEDGELPATVRETSKRTAVILTQSWCPDWAVMRSYLAELSEPGLSVYFVEYDRESYFRELMKTKERVFGNRLIPYVRYYRDGALVSESNVEYSSKEFLRHFER
jgi:hypothetical protein